MDGMRCLKVLVGCCVVSAIGCSHQQKFDDVSPSEAARINQRLVRKAVTFGPGADSGAVVPEVSAPCLDAELIPEHLEDGGHKLIEKHREWHLNCDVQLLGIPTQGGK